MSAPAGPPSSRPDSVSVRCSCGESFSVPVLYAGTKRICPRCGGKVPVPEAWQGEKPELAGWLATCPSGRLPRWLFLVTIMLGSVLYLVEGVDYELNRRAAEEKIAAIGFGFGLFEDGEELARQAVPLYDRALGPTAGAWVGAFAVGLKVLSLVMLLVLFYQAWATIQDGQARTSPAWAIIGLFIPFYQLYWIFEEFWGFAKDYNGLVRRYGLSVPLLSEGLFLAFTALTPLGLAVIALPFALLDNDMTNGPVRRFLILPWATAGCILLVAVVWKTCTAVNRLRSLAAQRQGWPARP